MLIPNCEAFNSQQTALSVVFFSFHLCIFSIPQQTSTKGQFPLLFLLFVRHKRKKGTGEFNLMKFVSIIPGLLVPSARGYAFPSAAPCVAVSCVDCVCVLIVWEREREREREREYVCVWALCVCFVCMCLWECCVYVFVGVLCVCVCGVLMSVCMLMGVCVCVCVWAVCVCVCVLPTGHSDNLMALSNHALITIHI